MLGNTTHAYNQTWHAPTSTEMITGEQYVRMACEIAGRPYRIQALPKWGVRLLGLFVPVLSEFAEMMYQYENDYIFDSSKIEKQLGLTATDYKTGISATLSK